MRIETYQVDAFTGAPFSGNPAAVCLLPSECQPLEDATRQAIAAEMNLSETAFVEPVDITESAVSRSSKGPFSSQQRFRLRWFTPAAEVPLCGHATLAAAYVLFAEKANVHEKLEFETLSGILTVQRGAQGATPVLQMDLPLKPPSDPLPAALQAATTSSTSTSCDAGPPSGAMQQLLAACVGKLPVEAVQFNAALKYLLVVLKEEAGGSGPSTLQQLSPDVGGLLGALSSEDITGLIVSCRGDGTPYDFHSRFFAPWVGITEDPVTGSAHSVLAAYWSPLLGKARMTARQCSPRGGDVWVDMGAAPGRVTVSGQGVVVLRGELQL